MGKRKPSTRGNGVSVSQLGEPAQRQIAAILFARQEFARLQQEQTQEAVKPARRSKYGAKRTVVDGISFASKLEADRWGVLRQRERLGLIQDLTRQPRFQLIVEGDPVTVYIGDFQYLDAKGQVVVEDAKGYRTPEYKIKRRLFEALHKPLKITEVTSCRM